MNVYDKKIYYINKKSLKVDNVLDLLLLLLLINKWAKIQLIFCNIVQNVISIYET
jgi:hypothetical protein